MLLGRANAATAVICLVLATGCGIFEEDGSESVHTTDAAGDAGDSREARRRCEPAHSEANDYDARELVAAFETSVEAIRESRPPSSEYEDVEDGRGWLCYFTGPNPSIAKSPPPSAEGETAETFDRVSFLVTEDGTTYLDSLSYSEDEPNAPADSRPLQQPGDR